MAAGRPVIAYRRGGALETVKEGTTGLFFNEQKKDDLMRAILSFDTLKFNPEIIKQHAEQFSLEKFKIKIKDFIDKEYENFNK
jgi:glycosyltransferase involved in cell wall biosynthesis